MLREAQNALDQAQEETFSNSELELEGEDSGSDTNRSRRWIDAYIDGLDEQQQDFVSITSLGDE